MASAEITGEMRRVAQDVLKDVLAGVPAELPAGYAAVPAVGGQEGAPLQVCIVVRREADPVAGHFVTLADMIDARVLLGCVIDAAGRIDRWIELWIQSPEGLDQILPGHREALTNLILDTRWRKQFKAFVAMDPATVLATGWEATHPPPTWIDLNTLQPMHPADDDGGPWRLCEDDALLQSKALARYTTSMHRYLYQPNRGAGSTFIPLTPDAPEGAVAASILAIELEDGQIPLNIGGGLLMVRTYSPLGYEAFVDVLSGNAWNGARHGRSALHLIKELDPATETEVAASPADGKLFLTRQGKAGKLIETYHLKLRLLAGAISAARDLIRQTQRPLLNLSVNSYRVRLGDTAPGLPFLWTGKVELTDPGDAIELPVENSQDRYYLPGRSSQSSIFRPAGIDEPGHGLGSLRIREVASEVNGLVLTGTFTCQERISAYRSDMVWMRVNVASGRVDLYARIETDTALASGEWRVRTVPQRISEAAAAHLRESRGIPLPNVPFEVVPLLSTPCDLYSLGVLAVRTLLVDAGTALPVALDELLSLARQVANEYEAGVPLRDRIAKIFAKDNRWLPSTGPHRLVWEGLKPAEAAQLVPIDLWYDTLGLLIRMFPAVGPDSFCRDYGDARPNGIHTAFDAPLTELNALLLRSRSLIMVDWRYNREVHSVIAQCMATLVKEVPPPPRKAAVRT